MTIAGLTFTVNQAGSACSFSLNPTSASLAAAGGRQHGSSHRDFGLRLDCREQLELDHRNVRELGNGQRNGQLFGLGKFSSLRAIRLYLDRRQHVYSGASGRGRYRRVQS